MEKSRVLNRVVNGVEFRKSGTSWESTAVRNISVYNMGSKVEPLWGVNWPACGTVAPATARSYAAVIMAGAELAATLTAEKSTGEETE